MFFNEITDKEAKIVYMILDPSSYGIVESHEILSFLSDDFYKVLK